MLTISDDIVTLFAESVNGEPSFGSLTEAKLILEDVESPLRTKLLEKLYTQVISKSHIDFDNIPESAGDIKAYSGYTTMMETLNTISALAQEEKNTELGIYAKDIMVAISTIAALSSLYKEGFRKKVNIVMVEYNLFVFCCVEATTSILSQFVEIVKGFKSDSYKITLKNTKYKADKFYLDQIRKFNKVSSGNKYAEYLRTALSTEGEKFVGSTAVGVAAVAAAVVVVVIPILRLLVFQMYSMRGKISEALMAQAAFLEMNRACVQGNQKFDASQKEKILKKQAYLKQTFEKLAEKIRVDNVVAGKKRDIEIREDNNNMKSSRIREEIDSSKIDFLL